MEDLLKLIHDKKNVSSLGIYEVDGTLQIKYDGHLLMQEELELDLSPDDSEFLRNLSDAFPNLTNLSLTSRYGSDGPWDYGFEVGQFPKLTALEVEFFTGDKINNYVKTHPKLKKLSFGSGGRVHDDTNTIPPNIKDIVIGLLAEEQISLAHAKRIIGKNRKSVTINDYDFLEEDEKDTFVAAIKASTSVKSKIKPKMKKAKATKATKAKAQCAAIAVSTGKRCRRSASGKSKFCSSHN